MIKVQIDIFVRVIQQGVRVLLDIFTHLTAVTGVTHFDFSLVCKSNVTFSVGNSISFDFINWKKSDLCGITSSTPPKFNSV